MSSTQHAQPSTAGGEKMARAAIEAAEKLKQMEAEMDAANEKIMAERRRKYVRPPVRFAAPTLQTKEQFPSKGFLRELEPSKFHRLRAAIKADDVAAFQALDVGFGSQLTWNDTPCSCVMQNRFSADRKYMYTFLDGGRESRFEKHHPYLPSRHREFTVLDFCHSLGANNMLHFWQQQADATAQQWRDFEQAKRLARVCAGCKQLVGDLEEHVFLTPPADPSGEAPSNPEMTKGRYYHLPCCRCEDASCGIVLDSDNFYLVDIQWGKNPPGPTMLCSRHKLKQEVEKAKFERIKAAEHDEELARQIKSDALRSKNPNEWEQVAADLEEGQVLADGEEPPKYWMHKRTGYSQWEPPPIIQAAIDQGLLNEQHQTIYVQSTTPEREKYLENLKQGVAGRKSKVADLAPTPQKDMLQEEEKERRFRDDFPEHVRYQAAQQVLAELEEELESHTNAEERQLGPGKLKPDRKRQVVKFFNAVDKQRKEVKERKRQLDETPDYIPTPAEVEHLHAEQQLCALLKEQALAQRNEKLATALNLQPKIDALRQKEKALAPMVRRVRAKRINDRQFDLRRNPQDQYSGRIAQRLRAEAANARRNE